MIQLLYEGHVSLFLLILIALVLSLCLHEFGHAFVAKLYGDDTAQKAGRLTLNPIAHIDPMGLLMVVFVGFGYAKPVPTDPRNFTSRSADLFISAAGPGMNLILAILSVNLYFLGLQMGFDSLGEPGPRFFFIFLAQVNLLLMLFNLIPVGALDGHYILPYFLPESLARQYRYYNARYGNFLLLALIVLSFMGLPIFEYVFAISESLIPFIIFL